MPVWHPLPPSGRSFSCNRGPSALSMSHRRWGWGTHLGFLPFLLFPPLFFPAFVPLVTTSGCAGSSDSGSPWCFFWRLLAWSPAFDGPRLRTGVWARTWPLREALSSARVRGGMVDCRGCGGQWLWCGGGSGKKEDVTWQHSCHIWNVTGRGPQRWVI